MDEKDNIYVCCYLSQDVHVFNKRRRRLATLNVEHKGSRGPESIWFDNKKSQLIVGGDGIHLMQLPHEGHRQSYRF